MPRMDTRLESEGAEFLVLGNLLIQGIATYKTYTNMPGYDLVATNPEKNIAAKIQVKSRWRTGAPSFLISNFECDFVVFCSLNRGSKNGRAPIMDPDYFVFPSLLLAQIQRTESWGKIMLRDIPNLATYQNGWEQLKQFLKINS